MKERANLQIRAYLVLLLVVVLVSFLLPLNFELLIGQRFLLNSELSVPVWVALLSTFLAGLLPPSIILVVRHVERDLHLRRERRRNREVESLDQRFRRAVDFHVDGQWGKAAEELEVLVTERPDDFGTLIRFGEVLRHQGDTEAALEAHRRASTLFPQSVALLYQLAEDYEALGESQVSHEIRNRILRDFPGLGLGVLRRRRDLARQEGDWDAAVRWQERVEAMLRETGEISLLAEETGITRGLTYQSGVALLERDRPEEAATVFRRVLEEEPLFVPAGIMLGETELILNNEEGALDEWRRGFKVTGSPVFLRRIEDYFIEIEEPVRAIEALRSLIAQADNDLLLRFLLARLYYRLEMHDEALKILGGLGDRFETSPTYHYLLGRIRQRRDDHRGAVASFLTCLKCLGVANVTFSCHSCGNRYPEWQDRCSSCGTWNSVDLDIQEVNLSPDELGVLDRPVWGTYANVDDTQAIRVVPRS